MLQTLWVRRLGFVFGTTVVSTSLVLSSFFFGLAVGSHLFGKRADRVYSPIRLYMWLELGIATTAVCIWVALDRIEPFYAFLYRNVLQHSFFATSLVKFLMTFALLSIPTCLMGGTLPVVARCVAQADVEVSFVFGSIYALNTFGAATGLLAGGFVLIELLGLRGAYAFAASMSLGAAILAATIPRELWLRGAPIAREAQPSVPNNRWLLALAFASGTLSIGYELLWIRLWSFISLHSKETPIGRAPAEFSSTYVFSFIVFLVLFGIALGSSLVPRLHRCARSGLERLAIVQLLLGGYGAIAIAIERFLTFDTLLAKLVEIAAIVLPATVLMGVGLPLLAGEFVRSTEKTGEELGTLYAMNTLGGAVGPFLFGLLLLHWKGTYASLVLLSLANLLIGVVLATIDGERPTGGSWWRQPWRVAWGGAFVFAIVFFSLAPSTALSSSIKGVRVLLEEDNEVAHTVLLEDNWGWKGLVVNNNLVSATDARHLFGNLAIQLPIALAGRAPADILILCVGTGGSWAATLKYPGARVTAVDINPTIFRGIPLIHSPEVVRELQGPRMRPVVGDARNFLLLDDKQYDLINIDPAPPITQPSMVNLHTVEFYRLARKRLKPGGVLVQRFGEGEDAEGWYPSLLRAIADVFPEVTAWRFLSGGGIDLIAASEPFRNIRSDPSLIDPQLFAAVTKSFLFGRDRVDALTRNVKPITDDRPTLEFHLLSRWLDGPATSDRLPHTP